MRCPRCRWERLFYDVQLKRRQFGFVARCRRNPVANFAAPRFRGVTKVVTLRTMLSHLWYPHPFGQLMLRLCPPRNWWPLAGRCRRRRCSCRPRSRDAILNRVRFRGVTKVVTLRTMLSHLWYSHPFGQVKLRLCPPRNRWPLASRCRCRRRSCRPQLRWSLHATRLELGAPSLDIPLCPQGEFSICFFAGGPWGPVDHCAAAVGVPSIIAPLQSACTPQTLPQS